MSLLRKRVKHYGKLPSSTIRDERLKHGALGLLLRIVDLPENWVVRADNLAAGRPQGRDATAAELRNLAQCGYYRVERRKMRNGRFQMGTAISEDSVPQWEAEYAEFDGKPIPLIEQPDGTFKVRRKDGTTTDDGFTGEYAAGANELPAPGKLPGQTGNGMSGTGKEDQEDWTGETDISGPGIPGSGEPASGECGPISNTEKYSPDVETPPLPAVGGLPAVTRGGPAPSANRQDQVGREAWQTATLLPRRYRDGLPSELRFAVVHEIRTALYEQFEPPAILRYAQLCVSNAAYAADKHLPLLRSALQLLRQDARMGLVCRACGNEPDDPFGPTCHLCRPMTETDLAELEAARAYLEGDRPDPAPPLFDLDDVADPQDAPAGPQAAHNGAQPHAATDWPPSAYSEAHDALRGASDMSDMSDMSDVGDDHGQAGNVDGGAVG